MKTIDRLITIGSLLKRWPGMRDEDIVSHMGPFEDDSILNGYLHIKTLRGQDGKPIHYCEATPVFPRSWMNGNGVSFDWSGGSEISLGIVFDLDDVERMESLHPEFRNAIILPDEILQIVEPTQSGAGYWINCNTLADRWKCSPFDVVEAIDEKGLNLDAAYGNTLFRHDTLDNFSVHSVDLAKFEHEHAEYLESFKPPQSSESPAPVCPKPPMVSTENPVQSKKCPAIIKDYTEHMPKIVGAVLAIKARWDELEENTQIKTHGFSESEIKALAPELTKRLRVAVKKALNDHGVKVWARQSPRPIV